MVSCPLRSSSFSSYGTEDYCWLRVDNFFILRYMKGVLICPLRSSSFSSYGTEDYCWLRVDDFFKLRYMKGGDLSTQVQQLQ